MSTHLPSLCAFLATAPLLFACGGAGAGGLDGGAGTPDAACVPADLEARLRTAAASFPAMPRNTLGLVPYAGTSLTFASSSPANDVEWTLHDTDFMEGETAGYDVFCPVDPADSAPGADQVKLIRCVSSLNTEMNYAAAKGDRVILGTAGQGPFFLRGPNGIDDDYVVLQNFDFENGAIELAGSASDYAVLACTQADGCATDGFYLFYTRDTCQTGMVDLVAFVYQCWDVDQQNPGGSGPTPSPDTTTLLCNSDRALSLANPRQFRFAAPVSPAPALAGGIAQVGSRGKEVNSGLAVDAQGFAYLFGASDGNLDGQADPDNEMYVTKVAPSGETVWTTELGTSDGAFLFAAVTDDQYLYAVGRTFGSLPGFQSAGAWDAILVKLRLDTGELVDADQWGSQGLDGYGTIALDDAGHLYVSGQGAPPGAETGDNAFVVARHRTDNLDNVWRVLDPVTPTSMGVAEAWGGITYVPAAEPGAGKLVVAGWFRGNMGRGADGFVALYGDLLQATPTRLATQVISSPGFKADWVFDNVADAQGRIYAVGYTTGDLGGPQRGEGDMYVVRFDPDLSNPVFAQWGTSRSDMFRKIAIGPGGDLYAVGYTYGDYAAAAGMNADRSFTTGDVVVQRFGAGLAPLAARQLGTVGEDRAAVAVRGAEVIVGGMTEGSLVAPSLGSFDAFVLALDAADLTLLSPQ